LQDGLNDLRGIRRGAYDPKWDWHAQNRLMVVALTEKSYDMNYSWGIGTHSNKQGGAMLPEMLRCSGAIIRIPTTRTMTVTANFSFRGQLNRSGYRVGTVVSVTDIADLQSSRGS
jgi:hypothetical protein